MPGLGFPGSPVWSHGGGLGQCLLTLGSLLGREKTKEALLELKAMLETHPHVVAHFPVEVRFTRGDEILLSPCFQRDSCYMNIIMYR